VRARACPTGAIHTQAAEPGQRTLSLSYARAFSGRACVDACPEEAVSAGRDIEVAAFTRQQLQQTASFDVDAATGACRFRQVEVQPGPSLDESAAALRDRIQVVWDGHFMYGKWTRAAATAVSWKSPPRRIRCSISSALVCTSFASPRHADVLLVTGPVTRNMEIALQRTYEATPEPRVVVAVGGLRLQWRDLWRGGYAAFGRRRSCLASGRVHSRMSAASTSILNGLLVAMGVRESSGDVADNAPCVALRSPANPPAASPHCCEPMRVPRTLRSIAFFRKISAKCRRNTGRRSAS
jgi:hypothetical protein